MEWSELPASHVDAVVDEHDTDFLDCWCGPSYYLVCDDCDPLDYRGAARVYLLEHPTGPGCWNCTNGLIPLSRADAGITEETLVVVHRA